MLAAEWGYGWRTRWLSNIHLGARDPTGGPLYRPDKSPAEADSIDAVRGLPPGSQA